MKDKYKTKEQLINELAESRQRITELETLRAERESSIQNWEKAFDSIGDFLAVIDKDFRFVRVNRALANTLKAEPKELIGNESRGESQNQVRVRKRKRLLPPAR